MFATETNDHAASFASPACTPPPSPPPPPPLRPPLPPPRRRCAAAWRALARAALPAGSPLAQPGYPGRPIRLVVPFPPGSGSDITARTVAQKMAEQNHWSVLVDNRPGAGGNLGVDSVAKSAPDGHTLVLGQTNNLAINPTLYPQLPYDPLKDLVPVALLSSSPIVLVTSLKSAFKTYADVVAAARMQPDTVTLGVAGSPAQLAGKLAENAAGIRLRHIPYKGAAQGVTDLVGGQIDLYISSVPTLLGQVRNGRLRAALGPVAGHAHAGRVRLPGLRCHDLVRHPRAGGHTRGHRAAVEPGHQSGAGTARCGRKTALRRRRGARRQRRALCRTAAHRGATLGQDRQRLGGQRQLISMDSCALADGFRYSRATLAAPSALRDVRCLRRTA